MQLGTVELPAGKASLLYMFPWFSKNTDVRVMVNSLKTFFLHVNILSRSIRVLKSHIQFFPATQENFQIFLLRLHLVPNVTTMIFFT